ncbi:MAG TPA: SMC-Scp complex subunit ScpB [Candidatus Paceibacterota bacterium]|nr:SMC-Scp complex subunit ScpB [Candidatus Paceibacterota bacterium]
MTSTSLPQAIEAILFATAEPYTFDTLAQRLEVSKEAIAAAVALLDTSLKGHGIVLTILDETVTLVTASAFGTLIESIRKEALSKELSKASSETLAIIAYLPGVSRSHIEFIRGVNAAYSIRALLMRGLIEQRGAARSIGYHPTVALLEHFGITSIEQLPDYTATKEKLASLITPPAV